MGDYNRDYRSGGSGRSFGGRGGGDREMHKATCANCGRDCEVPFRPTGSRPVLCNDCFRKNKSEDSRGPRRSFERNQTYDRPQSNNNEQFAILNTKLDKLLTLLTPKSTKPPKAPVVKKKEVKAEEPTPEVTETPATE